jgi:hypothetical protein
MRLPFFLYLVKKPYYSPRQKTRNFLTGFTDRGDSIFIQTDVINIGVSSVFRFDRLNSMCISKNRHFFLWIEKISKYPRPGGTNLYAGRFESSIDSMRTEGTFLNDLLDRMDITDCIRTCHHTIPASDTGMGIDEDDAIFPFKRGLGRTNGDTARVVTVVTEDRQKGLSHVWIESLLNLFDPCRPNTERNPVLHLASHFTGMAADAPSKIDDHAVFNLFHLSSHEVVLKSISFYFKV